MKFLLYAPLFQFAFSLNECFTSDLTTAVDAQYLPVISTADGDATVCGCDPVVARNAGTAVLTKSSDDWDKTATANYALGTGGFGVTDDDADACVGTDGGNLYFHGEEVVTDSATNAKCSGGTRGWYEALGDALIPNADKAKAILTSLAAVGDICDGSAATPAAITSATGRLKHMEVGDGTKLCVNLPYLTNGKNACADTHKCDWFYENATPCVTTTTIITDQWTAASATTNWCSPGTGAADQASPQAHRRTATGEAASVACATGEFCNWGRRGTELLCLPAADMLATTKKTAARATGAVGKYCLSSVGAKVCTVLETCDPNATARADVCLTTLDATAAASIVMAHGQAGDATKTYLTCINDGKAKGSCSENQVCNIRAGTSSGNACIPHTSLIGDFAALKGGNWTAVKQVRGEPTAIKNLCLSEAAGAKVCLHTPAADLEVCNPNAATLADLCIKKSTILDHEGEFVAADTAATPAVLAKSKCVAKTNLATCIVDQLCNQGSGTNTCILKTNVLENRAVGDDVKYCFGTDSAEICTKDTHLCNINGKEGGADHEAICVDKETSVEHLAEATGDVVICIGDTGSSKYDKDDEDNKDNVICDQGTGEFGKVADKMAPGELQAGGDEDAADCYGTAKKQVCPKDYYCNPNGTDADECTTGADESEPCTVDHICIKKSSVIADAQSTFAAAGTEICMASQNIESDASTDADGNEVAGAAEANTAWAEGTPVELCTETKQYCNLESGLCSEEAPSSGGGDGEDGDDPAASGHRVGLGAASVVAMLSAW